MKFFGGVARFHPKEVCSGNQTFVRTVFSSISSPDTSLRSVAVQTVGFIATSTEGKMALEKLGMLYILGKICVEKKLVHVSLNISFCLIYYTFAIYNLDTFTPIQRVH